MIDEIRNIVTLWRQTNQESPSEVALLQQGAVYSRKNELCDLQQEQPGTVVVGNTGCVFVVEDGNEYDGMRCRVVAPVNDSIQLVRTVEGLSGKDFVMLTDNKLEHFRRL